MQKAATLRRLLERPGMILAAGAHDAISAKLIEEAGFEVIWASGFAISAAHLGMPDAGLLTMVENLEIVKRINDAVSIPVIADGDDGYGNAINVMRTVAEFEGAGVAGICIEDNLFPKRCSFYPGVRRELVPIEEHVGKIKAAKAAQRTRSFVVIARTEALIAGWGLEEALRRAKAYAEAGADLVLVHSKAPTFEELHQFASRWTLPCPLVAVPTTYPSVTLEELHEAGVKIVIFANQALRAAIRAMRETLEILKKEGRAEAVSSRIVPLEEVYELVGVEALKAHEAQFLPPGGQKVKAIIVAAGFERELLPLTKDRPKTMLDIKGRTILERQIARLNECGMKDIVVVRGYKKEAIDYPNVRYYDNERFEETYILQSLFSAEREIEGRFVFLYADIIFERGILEKLLKSQGDIVLVVDRAWYDNRRNGIEPPTSKAKPALVKTKRPPIPGYRFLPPEGEDTVVRIGHDLDPDEAHGEFIGMAMFSDRGAEILREAYHRSLERYRGKRFHEAETFERASFTDMIQELIDLGYEVSCVEIYKGWMEINTFEDYRRAWAELRE